MDYETTTEAAVPFRSVGRRFSLALIGIVTLLLIGFAIVAIAVNIRSLQTELETKLHNTLNLSTVSLKTLLWNVDSEAVGDFIESLFLDRAIVYARVLAEGQTMVTKAREAFQGQDFDDLAHSAQFLADATEITYEDTTVGTIQLVVSRASIRQQIVLNIAGIVALTILVIAAIAVTSVLIARRYVARPLRELQHAATLIAGGELETRIDASSPDEIGLLARDLNTMRESIRHNNALLEEANHTLEQRVQERTAELAEANAAISDLNDQLKAENLRLGAELEVSRRLQKMLMPTETELRAIDGLDIACYMEPADEVGGDYYDVLYHNGQLKIGIGDVTGHGLESGVLMVMTQAVVRALLTNGETDHVRFLDTLNRALYGNVQRMGTDKNLTLSLLDYANGEVKLSGQHEEMIVVRQDGRVEVVDTIDLGFPIALDEEIAAFINSTTVTLAPGDGVVLYTDGITEAENLAGEQYGLERLCAVVHAHWAEPAEAIKEAVVADVRGFIGTQKVYDDITLVVLKQR
jgi:sigma-B regulation protein RsbU (phosphoserine phosphatase)